MGPLAKKTAEAPCGSCLKVQQIFDPGRVLDLRFAALSPLATIFLAQLGWKAAKLNSVDNRHFALRATRLSFVWRRR